MNTDSLPDQLATCDQEPIRTPGSIQPHGFLLGLDDTLRIVQASDNVEALTGTASGVLLGQPLAALLGAQAAELESALSGTLRERPDMVGAVSLNGAPWDVLAHLWDSLILLEFEPSSRLAGGQARQLYPRVGEFLGKVGDADSVPELCRLAAVEIKALTGFGRVLVYRFDDEGHGHVLAETLDDGYASYLGQRFPASDIPRQARELYLLNRVRLIRDAGYAPARLAPPVNPLTGQINDLTYAALRSVSPIHLQYMRNMGTLASMSVSLVVKGRLWGLISAHHAQPSQLSFHQRAVCEQIGQILALRIETREDADEMQFRLEVRRVMVGMLAGLMQGADFIDNMRSVMPELLRFGRAGGVAIVVDERVECYGATPSQEQIRNLVGWLDQHLHGDLYHTDQLGAAYAPAAAYSGVASGLLAMPISRIHKHYLLWFRPEIVYTIDWAGRPQDKQAAQATGQPLTPRTSFAAWRETIRGASLPWHGGELELALEFRTALLGIALERAEQMAELAEEMERANKELEAFSYSVSHDLRAPLRHIVGYADLLLEMEGDGNADRRQRFLSNIKESARLAGKLVDDLLSFSQMGRASLRPTRVNMNELVSGCIDHMALDTVGRRIDWDIGPLPAIYADPVFIQLAITNLLSNAVKFTAQREVARISVSAEAAAGSEDRPAGMVFRVADNGVGFNMEYVHKLFGVFQRLHRMEDFPGTGIGLANVRRIIERHGGQVWAEAQPGHGATFSFFIPDELNQ